MARRESVMAAALLAVVLVGCGVGPIRQAKISEKHVLEIGRLQWTGDGKSVVFDTEAWHSESRIVWGLGGAGDAPKQWTKDGQLFIRAKPEGAPKPTWYGFNRENTSIERAKAPGSSRIHGWDKDC